MIRSASSITARAPFIHERCARWAVILALAFAILPFGAGAGQSDGSLLRQLIWTGVFGFALLALYLSHTNTWELIRSIGLPYWGLIALAGLSSLWSSEVAISFKRWIQIVGVSCIGLALAASISDAKNRFYELARSVCLVLLALSAVFTLIAPGTAITDIGWRGFAATKNNFGQFLALTIIVWLMHYASSGLFRSLRLVVLAAATVFLLLSQSMTSILGLFVAVAVILTVDYLPRLKASSWLLPALALMLLILVAGWLTIMVIGFPAIEEMVDSVFSALGKSSTFTGRDYLWQLMIAQIERHPWFGLGYGGFWLGMEGESGQIAYLVKWGYPGQAHNGYIDLINEIGLVGLALLFLLLAQYLYRIALLYRIDREHGRQHLILFVFLVLLNLAESAWLRTTFLWWVVFVLSYFEVSRSVTKK